jgi:ribosomal protein S18 acetylase RimI-like enzyme
MEIRAAIPGDAPACAALLGQLGYPVAEEIARARIERLSASEGADVLVAEAGSNVVALLAYQLIDSLERERPQCRITTLVTDAAARRQGAARALLAAVEKVAGERGCRRLEVTTRPDREEALAFYAQAGFEERPRRLVKSLSD